MSWGKDPKTEEAFRALSLIVKSGKFLPKDEDKRTAFLYVERSHTATPVCSRHTWRRLSFVTHFGEGLPEPRER